MVVTFERPPGHAARLVAHRLTSAMTTRTLSHWKGEFGDAYTGRNEVSAEKLRQLTAAWQAILRTMETDAPKSILEVGANIGLNLRALRPISSAEFYAVEPNAKARERLLDDNIVARDHLFDAAVGELPLADSHVDLCFTSGVLIHVPPGDLLDSCREIHRVSRTYVLCMEYFAAEPETKQYHGLGDLLFKRDFGSFYLENFPDLDVVDYGFFWKPATGLDNITWWLFRKSKRARPTSPSRSTGRGASGEPRDAP